ncbi:peptide chain release factor N(5)-glutamine methyltransferase [Pontixanthobacter gangjinensis]|uniref:Release factor glutamine methyltransferase n=1 Tax=Christiangramia aestuarii TaxID=1028746 RepID=A0A7K1LS55_9FLAO|nr:peptide chain release factor N(5)-glutamine methyltransferase [Christiangramia aestuarii]MUP43645.1 peptide chain release factor N(5)-glutamine methyltransferase [Christiangramia aestuarii]
MQVSQLKYQFQEALKDEFPQTEIDSFFYILTEHYLGLGRLDIALNPGVEVSEDQHQKFEKALLRLKDHEPVQHITGVAQFYGYSFRVNKSTLIPRPETEELVDWIISDHKDSRQRLEILDIGTGSGCIPVSLAKELKNSQVSSFDISKEALDLARVNARENSVKIDFHEVNILETESLEAKYDIIVSNPPYVRELEKNAMHKNVLDHEPATALYVKDDDPLVFYRKIAELALDALKENGMLYFEINQYLGKETKQMLEELGFEAELKKDIFGNHRLLKASRK